MTTTSEDRLNGASASLAVKAPCRVATTANMTLEGEQTVDGVAVVTGDRVLVKNQTSGVDNGIYLADTSEWVRSPDCDGSRDLTAGTLVYVRLGTAGSGFYYVSTTGTIVVGTTSIAFSLASTPLAIVSAFMQTVLDDTTAAAARTTLGAAASTITVTGAGLATGGGDLSANRTITVTAASQSQQEAGSSNAVVVTPLVQHLHPSGSKGWAFWTSGTALSASYNVTSVTDHGTGDFTVVWGTDFSTANYPWTSGVNRGAANNDVYVTGSFSDIQSAGGLHINVQSVTAQSLLDATIVCIVAHGDQ